MYNVNVNGTTVASETSYEKAVASAKSNVTSVAELLTDRANAIRSNAKLYRSPRTRANVANALTAQATKAIAAVKFPKKSGDVSLNIAGVSLAIAKA